LRALDCQHFFIKQRVSSSPVRVKTPENDFARDACHAIARTESPASYYPFAPQPRPFARDGREHPTRASHIPTPRSRARSRGSRSGMLMHE
jgi:hypothetical protein